MMTTKPIGLYVHIPFCLRKCNYCDFCSFDNLSKDNREEYIDALCKEILSYKGRDITVDTIFFGGGTPSLLTPIDFYKIVSAIKDSFVLSENIEFTVEANPKTIDADKLSVFKTYGVNRISIGLQSIHGNELKILGRIHTFDDFKASYNLVLDAGIENINIDLMYGIPEQSEESFLNTLREVISLEPTHLSLYGLILEEGTPFFEKKDTLPLPTEDSECNMYYLATKMLSENGYNHYEISNYSKAGYECRHNLKYWRCEKYLGFGVSAYSYYDGARFGNTDNIEEYIEGNSIVCNSDRLDNDALAYEYVMLRLRLAEGLSLTEYKDKFGVDFTKGREDKLSALCEARYINLSPDRLSITESGFYVSNSILTELL